MSIEIIMTTIFSVLGGGSLVAIVQVFANRKKVAAEAAGETIKNAIEVEKLAVIRYQAATNKLDAAERLLTEVKVELRASKIYIEELTALLKRHGIPAPGTISSPSLSLSRDSQK